MSKLPALNAPVVARSGDETKALRDRANSTPIDLGLNAR
jgi:hypothetical protein